MDEHIEGFEEFEEDEKRLKAKQQKLLNYYNTKARKKRISQKIKIGELVQGVAGSESVDLNKLNEFLSNHKGEVMACVSTEVP